ncbi:MAG TPA: phosphoribosyltransferase [Candidatus Paceibacterota bacterium]
MPFFLDRSDAGQKLSEMLKKNAGGRTLVLALPRGGVPVAFEIAQSLGAPLDTIVARKIGTPFNPEFAVGAIAPRDVVVFDDESVALSGASRSAIEGLIGRERAELERRVETYKSGAYSVGFVPETILIVDDGIATGQTVRAASLSVRKKYPNARVVLAAPVCVPETMRALEQEGEDVQCLHAPAEMSSVGQAYENFDQLGDAEVVALLKGAAGK